MREQVQSEIGALAKGEPDGNAPVGRSASNVHHNSSHSSILRIFEAAAIVLAILLGGCSKSATVDEPAPKLIDRGWTLFRQSEFHGATDAFTDALRAIDAGQLSGSKSADAQSKLRLQAMYGLAQAWDLGRRDEDDGQAPAIYQKIIDTAPTSDEAAWSQLALARRIHVVPVGAEPDLEAVRTAYQRVIDRYPDHRAAEEAFLLQQSTYVAKLDTESAAQVLPRILEFIQAKPDSPLLSAAYRLMATCYTTLGRDVESVDASVKALETREVDRMNPWADDGGEYWKLASSLEFVSGDFERARVFYNRLIKECPTDQRVWPAKKALARMDQVEASLKTSH